MTFKTRSVLLFSALALAWARPAVALVADTMDTQVGYTAETAADDTPVSNNVLVTPGDQNSAIQLNFKFVGSGGYSQAVKDVSLADLSDLHTSGKLGFNYRWNGPLNRLLVRLIDVKGNTSDYRNNSPNNSGAWTRLELVKGDFSPSVPGFDYFRVRSVLFSIERTVGGAGTLDIDKVEMVRDPETATNLILNNFDTAPFTNAFSQSTGAYVVGGSVANNIVRADLDTTTSSSGAGSMKITYDFSPISQDIIGVYTPLNNSNLTAYRQIEFYAKGNQEGMSLQLVFGNKNVANGAQPIPIGGIGTTWKKFTINLTNYDMAMTTGTGLAVATECNFEFRRNLGLNSGVVWIDDLRFVRPVFPGGTVKVLDDMDLPYSLSGNLSTWFPEGDQPSGTTFSLSNLTDGVGGGRALRLTYDLQGGGYAQMHRDWSINASAANNLSFKYKYGGDSNHLQMNILDVNGVRFYRELKNFTATGDTWRTMVLPLRDFLAGDSTQKTLDLRKITSVRFTIVKDTGGSGFLALDDFEFGGSVSAVRDSPTKLIQSFSLDNATFSPDGDGVKDTVTFQYTLAEASTVRLRIYDQRGSVVRELSKPGPDAPGASSFTWDGRNDGGSLVPNGLYFFQFRASAVSGDREDKFSRLVAVMR